MAGTAAEITAQVEKIKAAIAGEKLKQSEAALAREKIRTGKLEAIADKILDIEVKRAETGLLIKQSDLAGDVLSLAAAKDKVSFAKATHALTQAQYRVTLLTQQHSLAASEESLRQLKSVAATLSHKLGAAPTLSFSSSSSSSTKED